MKKVYKVGHYWIEETMLDGHYIIKGPGIARYAGSGESMALLKDITKMLNKAYTAGYSQLARSLKETLTGE